MAAFRLIVYVLVVLFSVDGHADAARIRKKARVQPKPKYSAIVIEADKGHVLHNEDADGIRYPASLTKMMTLYLIFEALQNKKITLNTKIKFSRRACRQEPSRLGLRMGQTITIEQAILGLVTKSANDVAVAVAEHLGGNEPAFARRMTQKATRLGMRKTRFKNASGLPHAQQVTTARDMATLARALYRDFPQFYKFFSQQNFSHNGCVYRNHNNLLGKIPGVDGIKTGYIRASGFNLAASAIRYDRNNQPHRLITVVFGGVNRYRRDHRVAHLLEQYFQTRLAAPKKSYDEIALLIDKSLQENPEHNTPLFDTEALLRHINTEQDEFSRPALDVSISRSSTSLVPVRLVGR